MPCETSAVLLGTSQTEGLAHGPSTEEACTTSHLASSTAERGRCYESSSSPRSPKSRIRLRSMFRETPRSLQACT